MILEYAQMLSTAHQVLDGVKEERYNAKGKKLAPKYVHPNKTLYRVTHVNHPCSKWVRKSRGNYETLYQLFTLLCKEYTYRYKKIHKTEAKLLEILKEPPKNIPEGEMTNPPIAIADDNIKVRNEEGKSYLVKSYRNYYNVEKRHFAVWTGRDEPVWFSSFK